MLRQGPYAVERGPAVEVLMFDIKLLRQGPYAVGGDLLLKVLMIDVKCEDKFPVLQKGDFKLKAVLFSIKLLRLGRYVAEGGPAAKGEREQPGRVDPLPGCGHPQGHHQLEQCRPCGFGG
jgi:hypothetical protein